MSTLSDNTPLPTPFHEGEVTIQKRLGVDEISGRVGAKFIRTQMPEQHRDFFRQLPFLFIGGLDQDGHPWASYLAGAPGFTTSPTDDHLHIKALPVSGDPLKDHLTSGAKIGMLGIELHTRRRNRLNGTIATNENGVIDLQVDQSFGNCPKYIQRRDVLIKTTTGRTDAPETHSKLNNDLQSVIQNADVFFIASRSKEMDERNSGVDMSHRGGEPGFIQVLDENSLIFPDYPGNRFFNTLGNIETDGRVGLLFLDFENSRTVQMAAHATILWSDDDRSIHLDIKQVVVNENADLSAIDKT
ncbi:pyridoxamine 5'-phosphate oxidase family protein [Terasakiella sp. A23]|uniref:pyridoxamine 5'-phosphate oxidase family protein n=1 Tax=Terasakiella sp. FCG-A23 TaxID=3080561 RepID=UPI002953B933|nr:pyridoxamine 5'-phosphate oxidase family protein [Terasakiella sp. A23]MDV7341406.1 pyridoxamine 5'-phosphate oxidase family protein [Terasakiella sp. A23]